jgi:hypothetical protein
MADRVPPTIIMDGITTLEDILAYYSTPDAPI